MTKDGILTSEFDDAGTIDDVVDAASETADDEVDEYDEFDVTDIDEVRREDDEDADDDVELELVVVDLVGTTVMADGVTAVPGAEDVIGLLRDAGVKVAFTTGLPASSAQAVIQVLGGEDRADVVLSPADGRSDPYPDLPLTALLRTGATSVESMVVVGSTASGMAAGIASGAGLVVGVLTGADDEATLSDAGADAVIGSIAELPALLGFDD